MNALEVAGLKKNYAGFSLDVSFALEEGKITGFIGRNGAGKTTTIKSLLGFVHPDAGDIRFFSIHFAENEMKIKSRLGVVLGGVNHSAMQALLEEEDYTRENKAKSPVIGAVSGIYWLLVTAVYLFYTFGPMGNGQPKYSWFIWAVAGVLFGAVMLVVKLIARRK